MPYGAERKTKIFFEQSYCQSTTRYLNMSDLHDFLAAIIKMCFMAKAPQSIKGIYNTIQNLVYYKPEK